MLVFTIPTFFLTLLWDYWRCFTKQKRSTTISCARIHIKYLQVTLHTPIMVLASSLTIAILLCLGLFSSGSKAVEEKQFSDIAILFRFTELNRFLHCPICCVLPNLHNRSTFQVHNKRLYLMNFSFYFIQQYLSLSCVTKGWIFLIFCWKTVCTYWQNCLLKEVKNSFFFINLILCLNAFFANKTWRDKDMFCAIVIHTKQSCHFSFIAFC
jgi:hypothetical protein